MKKMLVFAVALVVGATALFAEDAGERSIHAIGFDVPIWGQSWYDSDLSDDYGVDVYEKFSAVGFDVMYHHLSISDNRFSSFINAELGYSSFTLDEVEVDGITVDAGATESLSGFNTRFLFGLGGAPLNLDKVVLAVHGTFGVNFAYGANSFSQRESGVSATVDEYLFGLWTTVGVNVESAVKLTGNFGLFAGINMYINLYGFGVWGEDVSFSGGYSSNNDSDSNFCVIYPGRFNVDFRFGVAFIF